MDLDRLIDEAKKLSRPSLEYRPGDSVDEAARWFGLNAGRDTVAAREPDGSWLVVGLDGRWEPIVRHGSERPDGGISLVATPSVSFPSASALFIFGSAALKAWLTSKAWDPAWGYNENFAEAALIEQYEAWWQARTPFYAGEADRPWLVTGGWVLTWPEDDEDQLPSILAAENRLLTLRDGEPWLEVRRALDGKLTAAARGT